MSTGRRLPSPHRSRSVESRVSASASPFPIRALPFMLEANNVKPSHPFQVQERKKQKVSEITGGLEDAEALIRKMDLEARSLPPNVKATLLAKLREYKTDLNNLKSEVKRMASANANLAARDDLLESGMAADTLTASADQRARLLMSTERLNKSGDRIREGRKTMLETEELGVSILQDLHQQRQSLLQAHNTLNGVDDNIGRSKKILTNMSRRMSRNKWIIGLIIVVLVISILVILYFKLTR